MPDRAEPLGSIDVDQLISLENDHFKKRKPGETHNPDTTLVVDRSDRRC